MAEIPIVVIDVQRGGPSTGLPTNVEQSDLNIAIFGGHGESPRVVMAASSVEDCFYAGIEAVNVAKKYSVPVILLTDQALATRIEAFTMPDLSKCVQDISPKLDAAEDNMLPYDDYPDGIARHAPPGTKFLAGTYPTVTGLEHDPAGHPSGSPKVHKLMVAKRRRKLQKLAEALPPPAIHGSEKGDVLLVGWGSTEGAIREAVEQLNASGKKVSSIHLRFLNPLPSGLEKIFANFANVLVVELNDEGLYGNGQLCSILRARFCDPKIRSVTKIDGLMFKVREIVDGVEKVLGSKGVA
jgi:2-oxoglutarate ferredoxin oxidoreductase subunit alpha